MELIQVCDEHDIHTAHIKKNIESNTCLLRDSTLSKPVVYYCTDLHAPVLLIQLRNVIEARLKRHLSKIIH